MITFYHPTVTFPFITSTSHSHDDPNHHPTQKTKFPNNKKRLKTMVSHATTEIKPDLRREITAWGLLVWAYRDESVHLASDGGPERFVSNASTVQRYGETGLGRGSINALLLPHEDALGVDGFVSAWMNHEALRGGREYVAYWAAKGTPPPHPDTLPREHLVPLLKFNGKPEVLYHSVTKRPWLCLLKLDGLSKKEIDRQYVLHRNMLAMCDSMLGKHWGKWKVSQRGLTACGESLTRGHMMYALRLVDE
jgi:hypothetical protein